MTRTDLTQRHALHGLAAFTNVARHLILQQHALAVTMRRIGDRDRRDELAGVRVLRVLKYRPSRPDFHDLPHKHHRHAMADALNHRHVVRDKQEGDPHIPL